jgi:RecA-family ATPase
MPIEASDRPVGTRLTPYRGGGNGALPHDPSKGAAVRTPPHAIEAEQGVLGGLLLDNTAWPRASELLSDGDFYRYEHRMIFGAISHLITEGAPADVITVYEQLKAGGHEDCCDLVYLNDLAQCVPSAANVGRYAGTVRDCAVLRRQIAASDRVLSAAYAPGATPAQVQALAREILNDAHNDEAASFEGWPDGRIDSYFETEPPAVQWSFHQRLLAGRGHLLAGVGGSSKTRVLYHLGAASVLGHLPWEWQVLATGSAALFLTEDVAAQVHRVLHQMGEQLKPAERRLLTERMRVFPLAGRRAQLLELNGNALRETRVYDWFMRQLDALPQPVVFVGIDPALGVTEGDELSPAHQRRLGELVDRIGIQSGASTVLSAHASKGNHLAEELSSHSARGSGAITDAVRAEITLRNMTADEARRFGIEDRAERQHYVQLAATKGNELPPEAYVPVWLKRGRGGALEQVSLEQAERGTVGQRELQALELLKKTAPQGDTTMRFWRTDCIAAGLINTSASLSSQEKAMERIRDALRDARLVVPGSFRGSWKPT